MAEVMVTPLATWPWCGSHSAELGFNITQEVHQALNTQTGAPQVWNGTGLQMLMPDQGHGQGDSNATPALKAWSCLQAQGLSWRVSADRERENLSPKPSAKLSLQLPILQVTTSLRWQPLLFLLLNIDKHTGFTGSGRRGFGFVAQQLGGTDLRWLDSSPKNICVSIECAGSPGWPAWCRCAR